MIRELPEPIQRFLLGYHAGGVTEAECRACSSPCCSLGGFAILENVIEIYELYRQGGLRGRDHEFEPGLSFEEFVFTHFEVYKRSVATASGDVVLMLFHMKSLAPDGHLVSIPEVGDYWETRAALFGRNPWLNAGCVFLSHRVQHWPHDDKDAGRHCILHSASSATAVTAKPIDCVFYTCNAPIQARVPSDEQSAEWFRLLAEHFPNSLERFQHLLGMDADGDQGAAAAQRFGGTR